MPAPPRTILDWRHTGRISPDPQPCVLCGDPTLLISPRGVPCHKMCAEHWIDAHRQVVE